MPESCYVCTIRNCCKLSGANGWIDNKRDNDCPLKSADKMITEIEYHRNKTAPIDKYDLVGDCLDIIRRYCDKENNGGNVD